ncbi:hypothetical protein BCR34DRAFT_501676, partial [Clohesyomyces aquaticus]
VAEPVSSIVTLATVSLAIIQKTAVFIRETQVIDETIAKLLVQLKDLRHLIKLVQSTCGVTPERENDRAASFIKDNLRRCQEKLEQVGTLVHNLASRPSESFGQKIKLNFKTRNSRSAIDESIKDIERLMDHMHKGVGLWTLQGMHEIQRQNSQAPVFETPAFSTALEQPRRQDGQVVEAEPISPLTRTGSDFSQTEKIYDPSYRRISSSTQYSRNSVLNSLRSHGSHSERNDSVIPETEPARQHKEWVEFHYQIKICNGKEAQIRAIYDSLQQHSHSSLLANSRDGSNRSPLHWAAQRGDVQLAKILLQFNAEINAQDSQHYSVLDHAVKHNQDDFVEFLLDHNVNDMGLSKQYRDRFEEMKEAFELRKYEAQKRKKKERKRSRTSVLT